MKINNKEAIKVTSIFFAISFLWIMFSDKLLLILIQDAERITRFQTYKGWFFIIAVSIIIYSLVKREIKKKQIYEANLETEKANYKTLFDTANDAIFILNDQLFFIDCNNKALELYECTKEEIIGKTPLYFSPDLQAKGINSYKFSLEKVDLAINNEPQYFEWLHTNLNKDKIISTEVSLNRVVIADREYFLGIVRNISERKKVQQELKESEEKYRLLVENGPSIFWITDKNGETKYISSNIQKIYGFSPEEIYDKGTELCFDRIHKQDIKKVITSFKLVFEENKPLDIVYRIKTKNGKWIWFHDVGERYINDLGEKCTYRILTDITESKNTQQKVFYAMFNAEEQERSRIAKDLHDGVSPVLSAIKLYTQSMRDSKNNAIKLELSEKISTTINEAIQSITEISNNISPHILQNFGLVTAVESFTSKITEFEKINLSIESQIKNGFSEDIKIALYRITTELITNTLKYASAKNISILYQMDEEVVQMKYTDDGEGFDFEKALENKKGMGIFNMRNRVNSLNGQFEINSKQNGGIIIVISIPLNT